VGASITAAVSCGRLRFDPRSSDGGAADPDALDGDAPDAPPPGPRVVAMTGSSTGDTGKFASLQVAIPQVTVGDLLVVAISDHDGNMISGVVDDASRPFTSAGARAANGSVASELWFEADAMPATGITVSASPPSDFDVWVIELAGTLPGPPASVAGSCLQYPPTIVSVPGMTTVPNELVVTVMMAQYPLYVADLQPPFTSFPTINGNDTGYVVPPQPGTYGATYDLASGSGMNAMTCASTAVWMPAP
jgi:hypothetical protein